MDLKCKSCGAVLEIATDQDDSRGNYSVDSDLADRFPPTWACYGGETFEYVYSTDPDYLIGCGKSDRIFGRLKRSINHFLRINGK